MSDSLIAVAIEEVLAQDRPAYLRDDDTIDEAVQRFYQHRNYVPAWTDAGTPRAEADTLVAALQRAGRHGLTLAPYSLDELREALQSASSADALARLDVRFTAAFVAYARDLHAGRISPDDVDPTWYADLEHADYAQILEDALNQGTLHAALDNRAPAHDAYHRLREGLTRYRSIAADGGWPAIPEGEVVHPGDTSPRVPPLRERLAATGYLDDAPASETDSLYDDALAAALHQFQQHHGLTPDSLLGPNTAAALNVPVEDRIRTIALNLERWRWLPATLGDRYVLVNIPAFKLFAYEDEQIAEEMEVIVGKAYQGRDTPVFTDEMEHLIFSPYWNIPPSIANNEIIPQARGNRDYLVANEYQIVSHYGPDAEVYDPYSTSLSRVESGELRLRQKPGPENALGLVKFMFPNDLAIYLHDTPAGHLFDRVERDFSHGCIRVERPQDLAAFALSRMPEWTRSRIDEAMHNGEWQQVDVDEHIPVYILYFTAYAEEDGHVRFYEDIYNLDAALDRALPTTNANSTS